ncbi:ATP-dependent DNA helicase [Natronospirillum operosum]|uniref:ATP-dependent DNA helicase n=1 Tax=Natronospirillum operosum TaxID=2759953 RepID=UPI00197BF78D|nr:ATP-dependent DNA helicase [Natronospirillum operosum]
MTELPIAASTPPADEPAVEAPSLCFRVGIRALCDFCDRYGDLDLRFTPAPTAEQGQAGHQVMGQRRARTHDLEVSVTRELVLSGVRLQLQGRVDALDSQARCVEEFKTHRGDLSRQGANQRTLHWAQVQTYGALLCHERDWDEITLRLIYFNIDDQQETQLSEQWTAVELEAALLARCHRFVDWARREARHRSQRDQGLRRLRFPFAEFRPGQRGLAESVYKAVHTGRTLLLEAPTGLGKTLGTLFPALRAMPERQQDRLLWLCARTSGRGLALDGLRRLRSGPEPALPVRALELVARERACEHPDKACHGDACPLAAGFYDRLPAARQEALTAPDSTPMVDWPLLDQARVRQVALRHQICPYYLSQELARWSDVIVADYNHYFDRSALLHALAVQEQWRLTLLVDEAHNLLERARSMYSVSLRKQALLTARQQAPAPVRRTLDRLNRGWNALLQQEGLAADTTVRAAHYQEADQAPTVLTGPLRQFLQSWSDWFADHPAEALPDVQAFYFEARQFQLLTESFDTHSLFDITLHPGRNRSELCLRNLVPAPFLAPRLETGHSSILFSATLRPMTYYRELLGLPAGTVQQSLPPVFRPEQLEVRVARQLSTRFRDRAASLDPIVQCMVHQYRQTPGPYMAYFSSFAYLDQVADRLAGEAPDIPQWRQHAGMSEPARDAFVAHFRTRTPGIGFAVLGGIFGEGIDLPGDQLLGVFIATLGLPQWNAVNECQRARLQQQFGAGYEFTYLYPGLQRVVQAAGRVIRTETDQGVIWLLDDRYANPDIQALLPAWWQLRG